MGTSTIFIVSQASKQCSCVFTWALLVNSCDTKAVEGLHYQLIKSMFFIAFLGHTNENTLKQTTMQTKSLQRKRALPTALLVLLLSAVGMGKGYAYNFSAICPTGQTLYYKITDYNNYYVCLTYPGYNAYSPWEGYTKPTGNIISIGEKPKALPLRSVTRQ